jgi:hypothetical protein
VYSQQIKNTRTLQSVSPCCFHERVPQLLCATAVRGQGLHTWREWWQSYGLWQQRVSQTHNLKSFYGQLSRLLLSFEFYGKIIKNLFFRELYHCHFKRWIWLGQGQVKCIVRKRHYQKCTLCLTNLKYDIFFVAMKMCHPVTPILYIRMHAITSYIIVRRY